MAKQIACRKIIGFTPWLLAVICLFMTGCHQKTILMFYPCINLEVPAQLDLTKVQRTFKSASEELLADLKNKPGFEDLRINYQVPPEGFSKTVEIEGPNALKKLAAKEKVEGVMYTIITQPFENPYCDSATTFYLGKSAVQTHQSQGVLMDYNTFYQIEFWKAELYQILVKIEGAL